MPSSYNTTLKGEKPNDIEATTNCFTNKQSVLVSRLCKFPVIMTIWCQNNISLSSKLKLCAHS